jgi:hypothetical protein
MAIPNGGHLALRLDPSSNSEIKFLSTTGAEITLEAITDGDGNLYLFRLSSDRNTPATVIEEIVARPEATS